jgi:Ca2+/Na+ antiporter
MELHERIKQKFWLRTLVFLAIASVIAVVVSALLFPDARVKIAKSFGWLPLHLSLWLLPPGTPHSDTALMAVWFAPAIIIGAAIGWLTYDRRWWLSTTGVLVALSIASMLLGA